MSPSHWQMCSKHGTDFLEYKCRYCCSVAVFFCFGTTHFCNACHDDFQRMTSVPKEELPHCPAGAVDYVSLERTKSFPRTERNKKHAYLYLTLFLILLITGPKGKQLEGTECPLHVVHPPTGEEFALGCGVCRNAHTF